MLSTGKIDWHRLETYRLTKVSRDHLPIDQLALLDAQVNVIRNKISVLEDQVCTLVDRWGDRQYNAPYNYTVTFLSEISDYPPFPIRVYPEVVTGDAYASVSLTRVSKIVDDIYGSIVQLISIYLQRTAFLKPILRTVFDFRLDLLERLSNLTELICVVVSQSHWFICHGFHPPAEFAKGN